MPRPGPLAAIAALALTPAVAVAGPSHVDLWTTSDGAIACGIKAHPPRTAARAVLCSSALIPPPARHREGAPGFVQISATGTARRLRRGRDAFVASPPTELRAGTTWSALHVVCAVARRAVRCHNDDGHGFAISATKYRVF